MCFDGTKPAAGPLMEAAAARALPERLRLLADSAQAAATEIEFLRAAVIDQARKKEIEFLRAAVIEQARKIERLEAEARGRPAP